MQVRVTVVLIGRTGLAGVLVIVTIGFGTEGENKESQKMFTLKDFQKGGCDRGVKPST